VTDEEPPERDDLNKRERAERGLDDLREMLEEIIEVGNSRHPGIDAEIDAARALEGIDRAEAALEKWDSRDIDGDWQASDCDEEDGE
jgi:hypothetical protein